MIVLNTRPSSKKVYETVRKAMNEGNIEKRPIVYLSSYVTPAQRIKRVKRIDKYIRKCKNPLIISTQCIEAGVDIDVDYIIRDWAPLDSIFQVCGRCNRNGEKDIGTVEIVHLISENNKSYSHQCQAKIKMSCFHQNENVRFLRCHLRYIFGGVPAYFELPPWVIRWWYIGCPSLYLHFLLLWPFRTNVYLSEL